MVAGAAVVGVVAAVLTKTAFKYSGIKLKKYIIVDRSPEELYRFWRNFENLPRFMDMLDSVVVLDDLRSRWSVAGPGGVPVTWDAEITVDRANEMIGWRSLEGSTVETKGYVRFESSPGARGTLVRVAMQYVPPAGKAGAVFATLFGKRPGAEIDEALRRFKQLMESGEIALPPRSPIRRTTEDRKMNVPNPAETVEAASEDSFPASDSPAWTGTGV